MARGSRPVAYFAMSAHQGVSVQQVHEMCREVVRRLGSTNCGEIAASPPCEHGNYAVTFTNSAAADVFEQLYRRQASAAPRRSATVPDGMRVVEIEVVSGVVMPLADYLRLMRAHLN